MTDTRSPAAALLARAGGIRGMIHTSLPVMVFALANAFAGLVPATIAAAGVALIILVWQLARRDSIRPALLGFAGVALGAGLAFITGRAKDFYLPGIWMYLAMAIAFTVSVLIRRPLVGVVWARATGRDHSWRRIPRVRWAFDIVTVVMAIVSWTRFLVQYYLYDTDQAELLAVARVAMGWPLFLVTSALIFFAIRTAIRAVPRPEAAG